MADVRQALKFSFAILVWICAFDLLGLHSSCHGQTSTVVLTSSNGETFEGTIDSIELDLIKLKTDQKLVEFEIEKITSIETEFQSQSPEKIPTSIKLIDGSSFHGSEFSISSGTLSTRLGCGFDLAVDTRQIDAVQFKSYENNLELSKQYREIKG